MSNSQKKRNVKTGGSTSQAKGGRSNTTGPQVGKKPASNAKTRDKALANARKATSGRNNQATIWIVAAVLVAALIVAGIIAVNASNDDKEKATAAADLGPGTIENGAITWGKADAPVTIDYYVDLLCPACAVYEERAADTVEKAVKAGKAKLVVHPVAILNEQTTPAGYSTRAAAAVLSAADKDKGYLYLKKLYEEQPAEGGPGLSDDELISLAEEVGLGEDWKKSFTEGEFADTPTENTKDFDEKGFTGTPTVLVNDKEMTTGTVEELDAAINA